MGRLAVYSIYHSVNNLLSTEYSKQRYRNRKFVKTSYILIQVKGVLRYRGCWMIFCLFAKNAMFLMLWKQCLRVFHKAMYLFYICQFRKVFKCPSLSVTAFVWAGLFFCRENWVFDTVYEKKLTMQSINVFFRYVLTVVAINKCSSKFVPIVLKLWEAIFFTYCLLSRRNCCSGTRQ